MSWHIALLGGLQLFHDNQELKAFQHRKVGVLLAYLAYYQDRRHERDDLVRLLWPDGSLDAGRNSLNVALSRLRKHLEDPSLLGSDRYQVWLSTEHLTTDVGQLQAVLKQTQLLVIDPKRQTQALEEALALCTGSLLPGFDEPWVTVERQHLADTHVHLLEQLAQRRGDDLAWDDAIEYSRRALLLDPYREQTHQLLLRLYREAGRPWAAKNHYDDMRKCFHEELNTLPSPETRALVPRARPTMVLEEPEEPFLSHLPSELSHFFGRETERAELTGLLTEGSRLITLLGTGGVGKTRLALETVRLFEQEGRRVFWAPLAEVGPESRLFEVILGVLRRTGVPPMPHPATPGTDPIEEELVAVLGKASSILVLDNLEHLPDTEVHRVIRTLLARVRRVTILGTSRRRLGITGEQVYHVLPLDVPEKGSSLEAALQIPSVRLLQDRVRLLKPGYSLATEPLDAILALCARLEGLPLAIEMAAARVAQMPLPTVLSKIEHSLSILVSSNTDVPERHRSLHATLLWSYNLLTPDLQEFLTKLSIFRGGWSLEAAEYVCERPDALDALQKLCDASLILRQQILYFDGKMTNRYKILGPIRDFLDIEVFCAIGNVTYERFCEWIEVMYDKMSDSNLCYRFIAFEYENIISFLHDLIRYDCYDGLDYRVCLIMTRYWSDCNKSSDGIYWCCCVLVRYYHFDKMILAGFKDIGFILFELAHLYTIAGDATLFNVIEEISVGLLSLPGYEKLFDLNKILMFKDFPTGKIDSLQYAINGWNDTGRTEVIYAVNMFSFMIRNGMLDEIERLFNCNIDFSTCSSYLKIVFTAQRSHHMILMGLYESAELLLEESLLGFKSLDIRRGESYVKYLYSCLYIGLSRWREASLLVREVCHEWISAPEWSLVGYLIENLAEVAIGIGNARRGLRLLASCEELRFRASWKPTLFEQSRWDRLLFQSTNKTDLTVDVDRAVVRQQSLETLLYEAFELPDDSPVLV